MWSEGYCDGWSESVSRARGRDVFLHGGPAESDSSNTYSSRQFCTVPGIHLRTFPPYSSVQFSDSSLYNILHHPAELFPCIRLLVYGGCNWLGEHKQDTGHLYHSASACVTLDQLLLSVSMKKSETDHKQNTEHL